MCRRPRPVFRPQHVAAVERMLICMILLSRIRTNKTLLWRVLFSHVYRAIGFNVQLNCWSATLSRIPQPFHRCKKPPPYVEAHCRWANQYSNCLLSFFLCAKKLQTADFRGYITYNSS
jgi:hypothetical protein